MSRHFTSGPRLLLAALLAQCLWVGSAEAYAEFPSAMRAHLDMSCTPSCSVCHTVDPGSQGTATKPFADALRAAGTGFPGGGEPEDVEEALDALPGNTNSDGDDQFDLEELRSTPATDPNVGTPGAAGLGPSICAAVVEYGCGAHMASRPSSSVPGGPWGWGFLGLGIGLILMARRHSRRSSLPQEESRG